MVVDINNLLGTAMKNSNPWLANFLAPLIMLTPMALISIHAWIFPDLIDDAPLKSSAFFFLAFPFLYLILVVLSFSTENIF